MPEAWHPPTIRSQRGERDGPGATGPDASFEAYGTSRAARCPMDRPPREAALTGVPLPAAVEGPLPRSPSMSGVPLGRRFGVEVRAEWSMLLVSGLVAIGLGAGLLPEWHPAWPTTTRWVTAAVGATLFSLSMLAHAVATACVARAHGTATTGITLSVFGGIIHVRGAPRSPRVELATAGAGPAVSIVLGVGATLLGIAFATPAMAVHLPDAPDQAAAAVGPGATLLLWLGPINVLLGLARVVPGFPLDGGRLLRAALWWATDDLARATRWSTASGRAIGVLLIGVGVAMAFGLAVPALGESLVGGVCVALIGWFVDHDQRRRSASRQ